MIQLTDDVRDRLASALADGCPVVAASVDADGQPHLSLYGTTQVYGPGQLAIWVRDPASSFLQRLAVNPRVAFMYRHAAERVMYQFYGQGRPVADGGVRQRVFDQSPEVERGPFVARGESSARSLRASNSYAGGHPYHLSSSPR